LRFTNLIFIADGKSDRSASMRNRNYGK